MRRQVKRIAVCVVVGVVVNVLVAWGCALWVKPRWQNVVKAKAAQSLIPWYWDLPKDWPSGFERRVRRRGFGVCQECAFVWATVPGVGEAGLIASGSFRTKFTSTRIRSGWPTYSFVGYYHDGVDRPAQQMRRSQNKFVAQWPDARLWREGFGVPEDMTYAFAGDDFRERQYVSGTYFVFVPARPVLTGFIVNSVFYASMLWMFLHAPGEVRQRRRRKRGMCVGCGYDLKGIAAGGMCPECGT